LGVAEISGSEGSGAKFFGIFVVLPGALAAVGGWRLSVRRGEVALAALVAGLLTGSLWVLGLSFAGGAGVFD
jgi:hypothetical protein